MIQFHRYFGRYEDVRGQWTGLPQWARTIVAIFAIPGVLLALLSILAFAVSLLALLLLTVPVYVVLKRLTGGSGFPVPPEQVKSEPSPGVKRVEATVVE